MNLARSFIIAAVFIALPSLANGQDSPTPKTAPITKTVRNSTVGKSSDMTFAKKAAVGGIAEVKLGQLAQQKGSNERVKAFGKRMEADHTKAGDELKRVAAKDSTTLPDGLDAKNQATYDKLAKLSGTEFDRAYMRAMIADHEEDVTEFKREANTGKDTDVKTFASQTLPTLEDHLKQARDIAKAVAASANAKTEGRADH